jgi:hypothetical protein
LARWTQKPGPPCHDSSSAVGSAGRSDGTAFMTFDEAAMVVPAFARRGGNGGPALLASRKAWDRLVLDLSLLDVAPVPGEGVHDAQQVWRGEARPSPGAPDGDASTGSRDSLDALIQRMERGKVAAAEEWASAYRAWAAAPAPPQCARPLPSPSAEELSGPHTRYIVPGRGGTTETIVGVRLWNGVPRGGRRYQTILCADDILGSITSWPAASVLALIMDEWAAASASHFGITDDASKSAYSAVTFDGSGVPREAPAPPSFLAVAFIRGRAIPRLPFDATYTHVGDPRKLNGDQSGAQEKNVGLCMAWLKRVEQMIRCSPREYARATNVGFASVIDAYSPLGPLTAAMARVASPERAARGRRPRWQWGATPHRAVQ